MSALLHLATFVLATHGGGGKGGGGEVVGGGKGVSSLLKDLGCGMANMAVPYFLTVPGYGVGRVMVDIGLHEGKETIAAVKVGFRVFAFEPLPAHVKMVVEGLEIAGLDYQHAKLDDAGKLIEPLREPKQGQGIAYIFTAGAGRAHQVRSFTVDGPGSSFVDGFFAANRTSGKAAPAAEVLSIRIVPVADYVDTDVHYFKADVQGFEMDVLMGALPLFSRRHVRLVTVELFSQGLRGAGSSPAQLLELLTERLGLFCFSSMGDTNRPYHLPAGHPESGSGLLRMIRDSENRFERRAERPGGHRDRWGFFDDLTCVNPMMKR